MTTTGTAAATAGATAEAAGEPGGTAPDRTPPDRTAPGRRGGPGGLRPWRAGLRRGVIELRHLVQNRKELTGHLSNIVVGLLVTSFIHDDVPGTHIPMAHLTLAGFAGYLLFQIGLLNLPQILVTEREEGTLLRLRATPGGIPAYLIAKSLLIVVMALGTLALLLGAGAVLVDGPLPHSAGGWLTLLWVAALGLLAVVPLGAALGAVLPNPREALALIMLPSMALLITSGAMFPLSRMPVLVQDIASVFPLRWIAQGLRSALLPDAARAAETAGSWQLPTVALVLAAWAVLGFLLAIPLLRRATRRESGSRLSARQTRARANGAPAL
ncbi:ABC transporter permease [Streptomyces sp. RS10V-4]|uniref:ABC transporter permease n=1 Tax=Streptomyces rhizoryzae TaxID=2932493 RepID=UPI002003FC2D|nr:ABC transporter permease [Streptomyces rhizoryzae]MCK7625063.1 ABC transporter permease [Streptomyces rhizoryzae]